jgi:hypothetical protein
VAKRVRSKRPVAPGWASLERVKFFARVDPVDAETFRAVRAVLVESEARRVADAEVFRAAVRALVDSLPEPVRARVRR